MRYKLNIIEMSNIQKRFRSKMIFENLNLAIPENKIVSIYGDSGSGKTTLLNIMGLIEKINDGEYVLNGQQMKNLKAKDKRMIYKNDMSFVFQNYGLIDEESIFNNLKIAIATKRKKYTRSEMVVLMKDALNRLGLSYLDLGTKVFTLSGGEQQRIALARLILKQSKVILADEPTGALDYKNKIGVMDIFNDFKRDGQTIVIVTHDKFVIDNSDISLDIKNICK